MSLIGLDGTFEDLHLFREVSLEPVHDKTNKMYCAPSEDSDLGIRPV